jgi:hypothetical protein
MASTLPIAVQAHFLKECFLAEKLKVSKRELVWEGPLRPSAVSSPYTIRVQYTLGELPNVYVLSPDLQAVADSIAPGRNIPHKYDVNPLRICVYRPSKNEWKPSDSIAITILPWTCMWISFFEDWVFTNVWSGGGEHPITTSNEPNLCP